jgi:hypothetical protein
MIDLFHTELFRRFGPSTGTAVMLGNQVPFGSTGFRTARAMMASMGYDFFIDIDYNGMAEECHDLNTPLPAHLHNIADFVFDGGTIEHVANIGEALASIVLMCKLGGTIYVNNPCNDYRMCYYNLDPLLKRDFFEANGFTTLHEILHWRRNLRTWILRKALQLFPRATEYCRVRLKARVDAGKVQVKSFLFRDKARHIKTLPVDRCYTRLPEFCHSTYIGRKIRHIAPIVWPHQTIYQAHESR